MVNGEAVYSCDAAGGDPTQQGLVYVCNAATGSKVHPPPPPLFWDDEAVVRRDGVQRGG